MQSAALDHLVASDIQALHQLFYYQQIETRMRMSETLAYPEARALEFLRTKKKTTKSAARRTPELAAGEAPSSGKDHNLCHRPIRETVQGFHCDGLLLIHIYLECW